MAKSDVISKNEFLTESEMTVNARYICDYLTSRGFTVNAVAGMLGNMQTESTINPGIWQNLDTGNTSLGFGLVQWTPATKLIEWANANGYDYTDIDTQLKRIIYERDNDLQFYSTDTYPMTFSEFAKSNASAYYLGGAFLYNYERPAEPNAEIRGNQALKWYNLLKGSEGSGTGSGTFRTHKLKLLYKYIATKR